MQNNKTIAISDHQSARSTISEVNTLIKPFNLEINHICTIAMGQVTETQQFKLIDKNTDQTNEKVKEIQLSRAVCKLIEMGATIEDMKNILAIE